MFSEGLKANPGYVDVEVHSPEDAERTLACHIFRVMGLGFRV